MSYQLIQQPAPLQQLADVLGAIRAQRDARMAADDERRMAATRDRRAERYLQLAEADRALSAQMQQANLEVARATLTLRQDEARRAQRVADVLSKRQAEVYRLSQSIPESIRRQVAPGEALTQRLALAGANKQFTAGVSPEVQAANVRPPVDLVGELREAQGESRTGQSGSRLVAPRLGVSSGGLVFDPGTENINLPSGGGASGDRYNDPNRLRLGNTGSLVDAVAGLEAMERENPNAAVRPWTGVLLRGVAMRAGRLAAGDEGAAAAENVGRTNEQTRYRGFAEQWVHNYIPNLPGFRMSVPMFNSVMRAFFPPPGESNPEVIRSYTERRRAVTAELVESRQRGISEEELAQNIMQRLRASGADDAAAEMGRELNRLRYGGEGATNAAGRPIAVPGVGSRVPRLNPRFTP